MTTASGEFFAPRRKRIGEALVQQGVITEASLADLLERQRDTPTDQPRQRLGQLVVDSGLATEAQVAEALATSLGLPLVDLLRTRVDPEAARSIPRAVCERYALLVTAREADAVTVVMADPTNVIALDDVRLYLRGVDIRLAVAEESVLRRKLARAWNANEQANDVATLLETGPATTPVEDLPATAVTEQSSPVVRLVESLLSDAVHAGASDLHIEPRQHDVRVRMRVDGLLREVMTVPKSAQSAVANRFKIISGLDIAERRRPQDGRTRLRVSGLEMDCRVSTLPALFGEKIVLRLLGTGSAALRPLTDLGLEPGHLEVLRTAAAAPQGLVLITGPTGSGKTSTLYSTLAEVIDDETNVITLEDPVEATVPGTVQVQINEKAGLTFAAGLRSVLRQDPDIVMVGEVRDVETAELAMQASLTGHLVLTTLHTNDAVSAVTRLVDMGVEPFLIASSLALVLAQRLVRTPCPGCAAPYTPDERTLELLGLVPEDLAGATLRRGAGCPACGHTGYRGRRAVTEVLPITAALRSVLLSGGGEMAIAAAARAAGMRSMRADAIAKALAGRTTLEEVLRVVHVDTHDDTQRCPVCTRGVDSDMVVCPWCAAELGSRRCAKCSRALQDGWIACPSCRTPAPHRPAAEPDPAPGTPDAAGTTGESANGADLRPDPELAARLHELVVPPAGMPIGTPAPVEAAGAADHLR